MYKLTLVAALIQFGFSGSVFAEDATQTLERGQKIVESVVETLKKMHPTSDATTEAQKKENATWRAEIRAHLDVGAMSQRALASHWGSRSATEKTDFTQKFGDLVVQTAAMKSSKGDYQIKIKSKQMNAKNNVVVTTRVVRKDFDPVTLQYELKSAGDNLKIVDLILDDASILDDYRSQFDEIIRKKGFADLMRRIGDMIQGKKSKGKSNVAKKSQ